LLLGVLESGEKNDISEALEQYLGEMVVTAGLAKSSNCLSKIRREPNIPIKPDMYCVRRRAVPPLRRDGSRQCRARIDAICRAGQAASPLTVIQDRASLRFRRADFPRSTDLTICTL
jgi:hypothetical protein